MNTKTYEPEAGFGKTRANLDHFGFSQNVLNEDLVAELAVVQSQLATALARIAELEVEHEKDIQRFGRCAAALDKLEGELKRLGLSTKLNTNAIDRLAKGNT